MDAKMKERCPNCGQMYQLKYEPKNECTDKPVGAKARKPRQPRQLYVIPQHRSHSTSYSAENDCAKPKAKELPRYHSRPKPQKSDNFQKCVIDKQPRPKMRHNVRHIMKTFEKGTQETVYLSHIVDPHNLYAVLASQRDKMQQLNREFRAASSLPMPSTHHIAIGNMYLVHIKAEKTWQRCRVVGIDKKDPEAPLFQVFCVDSGSSQIVSVNKLRLLSTERMLAPPLAVHCRLAHCEPVQHDWTDEAATLIRTIVDNKRVLIHIRHIRLIEKGTVSLECDMTTYDYGVSVAHALAFQGCARVPTRRPIPKRMTVYKKPKIYLTHSYKKNSVEEVSITNVVNPDNFFVRKSHHEKFYEILSRHLEQEYSLCDTRERVYLPEKDVPYVVFAEGCDVGSVWARGVVQEPPERDRVRVLLCDSGVQLQTRSDLLRHIRTEFIRLSALATRCHLAGVAAHFKRWSPESVQLLQQYEGRPLEIHVEDITEESVGVLLYDKSDKDNVICINKLMLQYDFAFTYGQYAFHKDFEFESREDDLVYDRKDLNEKRNRPMFANLEAIDKGLLRMEAKVLNFQSPGLIYMSLVHQRRMYNELFDKIQKYYAQKTSTGKEDWKVDDRCCTICTRSQTWCRAVILEIEGASAEVFYSDFAYVERVPVSGLRELDPEFVSVRDAAIRCHLPGMTPAGGDQWTSLSKDTLRELLDEHTRIFITVVGNFEDKSVAVELWVRPTVKVVAFEPNIYEWRCLNKTMIEKGLALPDRSEQPEASETDSATATVRDWREAEHFGHTESEYSTDDDEDQSNIGRYVTFSPLTNTEFFCTTTVMYEINKFELNVVLDAETSKMYTELYAQLQTDSHEEGLNGVYENKACLALRAQDGVWYRAAILQYSETKMLVSVKYVDHGKIETLPLDNLREIDVVYLELPPASLTAVIHGFEFNPHLDKKVVAENITKTFFHKNPFHVKLIKHDVIPSVELRNADGKLVYESLITQNVLLKCN